MLLLATRSITRCDRYIRWGRLFRAGTDASCGDAAGGADDSGSSIVVESGGVLRQRRHYQIVGAVGDVVDERRDPGSVDRLRGVEQNERDRFVDAVDGISRQREDQSDDPALALAEGSTVVRTLVCRPDVPARRIERVVG